jgi:beta-lactamase class A
MRPRGRAPRRRDFVALAAAGALLPHAPALAAAPPADPALAALEARSGGRLGFAAVDVATGRTLLHRADERFPMCSVFKWLLATAFLSRADRGVDSLDRWIAYKRADLLPTSPVTEAGLARGALTVGDLAQAVVEVSDNTAANLLLAELGGPAGLTRWLRNEADQVTRLDRTEMALNSAVAGDPRDTTTPMQMCRDLIRFPAGPGLSVESAERLIGWMVASKTGLTRLRAGLPRSWKVGDKTGTGANGSTNDVAIAWPAEGAPPIVMAAFMTGGKAAEETRQAVHADLGRLVAARFGAAQ